jgi:hypothetical protein
VSNHMSELALKKRMLQQRSAVLRHAFALQVNAKVAPVAGMADRALSAGRWLGRHPYGLLAVAVALTVWRPSGMTRLAERGLWLWQTWQRLRPMVMPLMAQLLDARKVASEQADDT